MALIATISEQKKQSSGYPKLCRYNEPNDKAKFIVLFTSAYAGTVVYVDAHTKHPIGYYSQYWSSVSFEDFHGSIEITTQ